MNQPESWEMQPQQLMNHRKLEQSMTNPLNDFIEFLPQRNPVKS